MKNSSLAHEIDFSNALLFPLCHLEQPNKAERKFSQEDCLMPHSFTLSLLISSLQHLLFQLSRPDFGTMNFIRKSSCRQIFIAVFPPLLLSAVRSRLCRGSNQNWLNYLLPTLHIYHSFWAWRQGRLSSERLNSTHSLDGPILPGLELVVWTI